MGTELACFISPHGFGHATRTIALLQAIREFIPDLTAHLFTTVDQKLFENSGVRFSYHQVVTDVGLVQHDAFLEDPAATIAKLAELVPFSDRLVESCARLCCDSRLILCDISCLGIAVGQHLKIPSILVENFTWDWIYARLSSAAAGLQPYGEIFAGYYAQADHRIQTEPVCARLDCDLSCAPIARKQIRSKNQTRSAIGCKGRKTILISLGGITQDLPFIAQLGQYPDYYFVIAAGHHQSCGAANVKLIGPGDHLHHPDLIHACDLLICKSGYSTIAECLQTDAPICCVAREGFAESALLEQHVAAEMNGTILTRNHFLAGDWLFDLPELLTRQRRRLPVNGADQAADFICSLL